MTDIGMPGSRVRDSHAATVGSIVGSALAIPVVSAGKRFLTRAAFGWRVVATLVTREGTTDPGTIAARTIKESRVDPMIQIAQCDDQITTRTYCALIGGAAHEAFHRVYSHQGSLTAKLIADAIQPVLDNPKVDWKRRASLVLDLQNVVEDICIERIGIAEYPGCRNKLVDLADYIVKQEAESRLAAGNPPPDLVSTVFVLWRDLGLGYNTPTLRDNVARLRAKCRKGYDMVVSGVLADIVRRSIPDVSTPVAIAAAKRSLKEGLSLRLALEAVALLEGVASGELQPPPPPPPQPGKGKQSKPSKDGEPGEPGEGSPTPTKSKEQPKDSKDAKPGKGKPQSEPEEGDAGDDPDSDDTGDGSDDESEDDTDKDASGKGDEDDSDDESDDDSDKDASGDDDSDDSDTDEDGSDGDGDDGSDEDGDSGDSDGTGDESGSDDGDSDGDGNSGKPGEAKPGDNSKSNEQTGDSSKEHGAGGGEGNSQKTAGDFLDTYDDKGKGALDSNAALEQGVAGDAGQDEPTDKSEAAYKPWTTVDDEVRVVKPDPTHRTAFQNLVKLVRRNTAYLKTRLASVFRGLENTGIEHGVRKARYVSDRMICNTALEIRQGFQPTRAYVEKTPVIDMSVAAVIVVDESYSMNDKVRETCAVTYTLADALDSIGAKVFALGFRNKSCSHPAEDYEELAGCHRDHAMYYDVFKSWDERFRAVAARFIEIRAQGGTPMADGVEMALHELSGRPEAHRVVFVVTDGQPDGGHQAVLRNQLRRAREAGVLVVGVGLGHGSGYVTTTFPDSVYSPDLGGLPKLLVAKLESLVKTRHGVAKRGVRVKQS